MSKKNPILQNLMFRLYLTIHTGGGFCWFWPFVWSSCGVNPVGNSHTRPGGHFSVGTKKIQTTNREWNKETDKRGTAKRWNVNLVLFNILCVRMSIARTQPPKMLAHLWSSSLLLCFFILDSKLPLTALDPRLRADWPASSLGLWISDSLPLSLSPNWQTASVLLFRPCRFSSAQLFVWPLRQNRQRKVS